MGKINDRRCIKLDQKRKTDDRRGYRDRRAVRWGGFCGTFAGAFGIARKNRIHAFGNTCRARYPGRREQEGCSVCRQKGVPCRICPVSVPEYAAAEGLGIEEAARILRYDCYQKEAEKLKKNGAGHVCIALAHHANDNAETVLFQMARGSGIHGMCGMHPKRVLAGDISIVRPLLCVSRKQIEEYLDKAGQEYRTDGTHLDINYSRNRIRHCVLPELLKVNEQSVSQCTAFTAGS